jgi:hypothetical protein
MRQFFSFVICVMLSSTLHGMEMVVNNDNCCTDALLSKNKDSFARDVIILNRLLNGDHDTYRTIAMLSKTHNAIVENNYRPTKKRIEGFDFYKTLLDYKTGHISWNKDFSKCATITIIEADPSVGFDKQRLILSSLGLDNNNLAIACNKSWDHFEIPILEDNGGPFFGREGRVYFYGYGNVINSYRNAAFYAECSIGLGGETECYMCEFVTVASEKDGSGNTVYPGSCFFNFPVLLKAWLQSKIVRISKPYNACKSKVYNINGVTLPYDYRTFKKHVGWKNYCARRTVDNTATSYDSLSADLRDAIDAKYAKQEQEKNEHK